MADVFISYKSDDRGLVQPLVDALRRAGLSVWWDRDIPPSAEWEDAITAALARAKCVIVCWTEQSTHPKLGQKVQVEAREAQDAGKLLQALVEKVRPPLFFRSQQALDLSGWNGDAAFPAFQQLTQAARDIVAGRAPELAGLAAPQRRGGPMWHWLASIGGGAALAGIASFAILSAMRAPDEAKAPQAELTRTETEPAQAAPQLAPAEPQAARRVVASAPQAEPDAEPAPRARRASPPPAFTGRNYRAELEGCELLRGGAECTLSILSDARIIWQFNNLTYLADANGGQNRVVEMTVGNHSEIVAQQRRVIFEYIEPGVRTRIVYRFEGDIEPSQTQALVFAIMGSWTGSTQPLSPIPWR